ncbi:MAG: hypothetical protein ACREQW_17670 [Candidatus Binatia bacterium]
MSKEILVAIKSQDRIEDIIPCLERVAQPGTKVTFLLRYPVDGYAWAKEEGGTVAAALEAKRLAEYYSWQQNVQRAERKVSSAFEVLSRNGAEVAVDVYAGSLKKAISNHAMKGDVHSIITRAGIGHWITSFFNGTNCVLRLFKRPRFSPVLLIQPRGVR